ncbi:DUF924 family protein [Cyanobium sp. CH-040]|uniref:DUF924 family protein n=1 Tax=Cyanobium sp. CH-040 TaxID=2823708 RepID=UPI0020CF82C2|nr:DUF924 family protein [Cyanobium sp. CH-040]
MVAVAPISAAELLRFWFEQSEPRHWFSKDPAFDAQVRERFSGLTRQAIQGELSGWASEPRSGLALVLLLDQFPRQIWRGSAMAFAGDSSALALSLGAVERGWVAAEPEQARRQLWLMSQMHSEVFARRHRDVIARFGRFPHRNAALGRVSSAEELAFLQTPGSGF